MKAEKVLPQNYKVTIKVEPAKGEPGEGVSLLIRFNLDRGIVLAEDYPAHVRSLVELLEKSVDFA